jgi:hypothetical protein
MVDSHEHLQLPERARLPLDASALAEHLEMLTIHSDDAVVRAAHSTLQYLRTCGPLDARSFDKVYLEITRQGGMISRARQLHEWRAVRGVAVSVYHALLRQFRDEVKKRHAERLRPAPGMSERDRCEPAGV